MLVFRQFEVRPAQHRELVRLDLYIADAETLRAQSIV